MISKYHSSRFTKYLYLIYKIYKSLYLTCSSFLIPKVKCFQKCLGLLTRKQRLEGTVYTELEMSNSPSTLVF